MNALDDTPAGPVSLFHSVADNDEDLLASDYEDTSYVDTDLDLVGPADDAGRYYDLDVTDLVLSDYAADGSNPLSAFRLQVTEAMFSEDDVNARYRFTTPGAEANHPQLVLTFIPEPSTLVLTAISLLGLAVCGRQRRICQRPVSRCSEHVEHVFPAVFGVADQTLADRVDDKIETL